MSLLAVYVTPKAERNEVAGWRGRELSVRVCSAPEAGKANAAVCKVIAKSLGISNSSVSVVRGEVSRHKQLEVAVEDSIVRAVFGEPDEPLF